MALERVSTKGTGKAGHHSSRWARRRLVKEAAKKLRRREAKQETTNPKGER